MNDQKTSVLTYTQKVILAVLSDGKETMVGLTKKVGLTRGAVTTNVRKLTLKGLVFADVSKHVPVYGVHIKHAMPKKSENIGRNRQVSPRLRSILEAIDRNGPMTVAELADWIGCSDYLIFSAATYYRKGGCTAVLRVSDWVWSAKGYLPVYGRGPKPDAEKPTMSKKERDALWRERNRAKIRAKNALYRQKRYGSTAVEVNPFWQLVKFSSSSASSKGVA